MATPSDSTTLARRRIHASVAQKFGAFYRGLPAEEQQAVAAILEQAVHLAEHSGFSRSGDGIGALLYGAQQATQTLTEKPPR
jgi:hypothetical protein